MKVLNLVPLQQKNKVKATGEDYEEVSGKCSPELIMMSYGMMVWYGINMMRMMMMRSLQARAALS